ncbi:hypothetical protein Tco_0909183 [Tanacetum coccineum]|uniref:Reverse transcriptase n=1 Tax=Tanacetum coccineum TaxID=301880 RepID=A0ABQ5CRE1_9ASTR
MVSSSRIAIYVQSVTVIKEALEELKIASGLVPSLPKSTAYLCNVLNHIKISILHILPFEEGRLPVKYLGVPLVSSRLRIRDCKELIERVQSRVHDWKNKTLSIVGRLQLITSVLGSMHIYWASVFVLPSRVLLDIEQIMRGFLWCHGDITKGKAKVAWEVVCLPKDEGGLGIGRLDLFNSTLMVSHVWKLLSLKESLWVKWIHAYKLNGLHLAYNRDGANTSLWYDRLCDNGLLSARISNKDVFRVGLNLSTLVKDIIHDGAWNWPPKLLEKYPFLNSCLVPIVESSLDKLEWRSNGVSKAFSISQVWSTIRPRAAKVCLAKVIVVKTRDEAVMDMKMEIMERDYYYKLHELAFDFKKL